MIEKLRDKLKNKTKTYVLLTAVLAIWGIIGYKIIFAVKPSSTLVNDVSPMVAFKPELNKAIDTFSIQTVKRDPFLGTLSVKKKKKTKIVSKPKTVWMPVLYHGRITKKDKKNTVFIVSINNVQYLLRKGQTVNEVKLVNGDENSVKLNYKGLVKQVFKI